VLAAYNTSNTIKQSQDMKQATDDDIYTTALYEFYQHVQK